MKAIILPLLVISSICILSEPVDEKNASDPKSPFQTEKNTIDSIFDPRDGRWYRVIRIDSLYWFNENLSFESANSQVIVPVDGSKRVDIRVYSFKDSKTACPTGWRLPTVKEFDNLITAVFGTKHSGIATLKYDWATINSNPAGFNFDRTGFLHKKKIKSSESFNLWLDDKDIQNAYHVHMYDTNRKDKKENLTIFRHTHEKHNPKKNRKFSVRCVCEAGTLQWLNPQ